MTDAPTCVTCNVDNRLQCWPAYICSNALRMPGTAMSSVALHLNAKSPSAMLASHCVAVLHLTDPKLALSKRQKFGRAKTSARFLINMYVW